MYLYAFCKFTPLHGIWLNLCIPLLCMVYVAFSHSFICPVFLVFLVISLSSISIDSNKLSNGSFLHRPRVTKSAFLIIFLLCSLHSGLCVFVTFCWGFFVGFIVFLFWRGNIDDRQFIVSFPTDPGICLCASFTVTTYSLACISLPPGLWEA